MPRYFRSLTKNSKNQVFKNPNPDEWIDTVRVSVHCSALHTLLDSFGLITINWEFVEDHILLSYSLLSLFSSFYILSFSSSSIIEHSNSITIIRGKMSKGHEIIQIFLSFWRFLFSLFLRQENTLIS